MNEELRNIIGKAAYDEQAKCINSLNLDTALPWDELLEDTKEDCRRCAEKVIEAFIQPIMPTLANLTKSLIGLNQHQQDAIRHIVRVVTGKELEEL